MARKLKTPLEKLETKITNILSNDPLLIKVRKSIKFNNKVLFKYNKVSITYTKYRYYSSKIDSLVLDDFIVSFPLSSENISLVSTSIVNPPKGAKIIVDHFRRVYNIKVEKIIIGSEQNKLDGETLHLKKNLYETLLKINREEGKDKIVRFNNRALPFVKSHFEVKSTAQNTERDYSLLLSEIIESGDISQQDIMALIAKVDEGNNIDIVIKKQVNKQAEWLIEKIEEILEEKKLSSSKAKELGNKIFGFTKSSIKGPEHLMEKILSQYGKYTLFGVPVLLNTDKYVINSNGRSRSQFDIILINHLSDIEVVELKRSDTIVLSYDENRSKFYASKDLSIAVSQAERYISSVYKDNDEDYKINGQKIKDFLNSQIGGTMNVDICRPKALIVLGSYQTIAEDYENLSDKTKRKISKKNYTDNYLQAYKELKEAYKNIHILTYSELVENARTRLTVDDD